MNATADRPGWATAAILIGRLVFAALFLMAVTFKIAGPSATATQIAAAGFPMAGILVWCAIVLEVALVLAFLTGAYFREAALVAAVYVIFLAFGFHGPSHWQADPANQTELGFFIDHFTFAAGLLFAAACGPGRVLASNRRWI